MTTATATLKPVPAPTPETAPFWNGLKEGRLLFQQCAGCGKVRHYPRSMCDACYAQEVRWVEAKGTGKLHSWTETHHAFAPGFKAELPYILATIDMAEGVRMQAPLRGARLAELAIGKPVRVSFEPASGGLVYPAFVLGECEP